MTRVFLSVVVALLAGCATTSEPLVHSPGFSPVYPAQVQQPRLATGAIFDANQADTWFGRNRNFQIGDVVTVLLNESLQANREQNTDVERKASNDVIPESVSTWLGNQRGIPMGINLNSANVKSEGTGSSDQAASLIGSVAVTVIDVLPNGNLVLRGEKQLQMTEGTEVIQVSGIVRPADIAPNFTVQSRRLANAQISYRGTGDLANAAKPGWGTNLLMKLWPF
jgi:flagellar L-ring protein precursor FlgH